MFSVFQHTRPAGPEGALLDLVLCDFGIRKNLSRLHSPIPLSLEFFWRRGCAVRWNAGAFRRAAASNWGVSWSGLREDVVPPRTGVRIARKGLPAG